VESLEHNQVRYLVTCIGVIYIDPVYVVVVFLTLIASAATLNEQDDTAGGEK
jgi:hypothetical protein